MATKLSEHTYGTHVFMRLRLDDGRTEEITAYVRENGWEYRTSADNRSVQTRLRIIAAFHQLY